ncbi:cell division protein FtsZ [Labilibaculum antarcticum]|uniref:Cell division protein FtsZ n=1 Tax=Labilibaculum antarcticum TaxID=1717717 RepID=A0A1Y1CJV9_9BACT|nr:cell division protein FtsZ [Labilibaculum antarcticum]BAX80625.1 cell division protein FtsZ [Labilibaculum antarcticum]
MTEDLIDFSLQENESSIIKVIGVGGGGGNAVNYMYKKGIKDVDFIICNTDAQALETSEIPIKIQLGESLTEGRGAGNKPERGEQSAIENLEDINEVLADNTKMVFITAGMGGGTGTGAAPVIAKAAKDMGILTVGIVTIPFRFEGRQRLHQAIAGINKLKENVDSLLVINNEKLSEIYGDLKLSTAFSKADDVLATAAKGIAEIITLHGYINVDFEDVKTVMTNSGVAVMGSASAEGENRAVNAIREALTSPLLNSNDIRGARNILLNISSGEDEVTMDEVGQITDFVQEAVGDIASIIWGTGQDSALGNKVAVTIIATGFDNGLIPEGTAVSKPTSFQAGRGRSSAVEQIKMDLEDVKEKSEERKLILTDLKDTEIDEIENIPAYKRKLTKLGNKHFQSGKIIRFSLDEE